MPLFILLLTILLASCAPTVPYNPDFPIQIGETWQMVARGKAHTFSLTQQTSSPQAAQLKFFIYEGTDALGNTVEVSSLAKMVLTARVFSKAKLNKDQRSTERALVCTAFLVEGRWLGTLFEGSLFEEVDSQIKANASAGSEEVCEIRKVG